MAVPQLAPAECRASLPRQVSQARLLADGQAGFPGQMSAAVTVDVYSDLFDDDLDAVAAALNEAALRSSVGKMWAAPEPVTDDTVSRN